MAQTEDTIETPALGRPFQLGMLYDCRKDALIPGITLWDYSSLQKDLTIKPQPKTESEILMSDTIDDKASALDISASLKGSFLGGMIDVGGSAKYLHDTKRSKQQARVTVQYKTTTRYEQLTMSHLGIQNISHPAIFEHGTATHVVTAILYGAQAFFVFDREVSSTDMVKNIEGDLQVTLTKEISIGGEAEVRLTEEEKKNALKFRCKFHGDFSLDKNPVSFPDAIKVYETLPKKLGKDGEKAVPMRVWLYPLTKLDTRAAKLVHEISLTLIFDTEKILEELNEIEMQSNDLAENLIAETFPEIKRKIQQLKDLCRQHRQIFRKQLAKVLPSIRGGGQEEGTLVDILASVNQSPFNSRRLREFLDTRKREVNFVKSYLTILADIKVISSQNLLEQTILDPQNVYVVSFTFTSLHEEEPFLLSLQDWLQEQFLPGSTKSTRSTPREKKDKAWFEDKERTHNARRAAKSIKDFFSINQSNEKVRFVVASIPDEDNQGASIYLYEDGELVSKNFELPAKPLPLLILEQRHDSIQLRFQPAEYGKAAISSYVLWYKVAGEENWATVLTGDAEEMFLLKDLSPNTEYQFEYAACCRLGFSESSDLSPLIKTLHTSPPEELRKVTVASSAISVAWMSPSIVASGVVVKEYKVEYRTVEAGAGKDHWTERKTGRKTEFYSIEGLMPQTVYRLRVSAVCDNGALSVPSKEVEVSTSLEEEDAGNVAHQFVQKSSLVEDGELLVFALPVKETPVGTSTIFYDLGQENTEVATKKILLIGGTQSGKTTLINGMVNYILGVQWEDHFRFRFLPLRSKAESETWDTAIYLVHHQEGFRIPYSLVIIATQDFGNVAMAEKEIEEHFQELCSLGSHFQLGAICFVAQDFHDQSAHTQKCMFDFILSKLAKDVEKNVQLLITFADGGSPPVLVAVEEDDLQSIRDESGIPLHFRPNNSVLFADQENGGSHSAAAETFWEMTMETLEDFFDSMITEEKSSTLAEAVSNEPQEPEAGLRCLPSPKIEQVQPNLFLITIDPLAERWVSRFLVEFQITGKEERQSLRTEGPQEVLEDVQLSIRCAAGAEQEFSQWSEEMTCICPMKTPEKEANLQGAAQTEVGQC